MIRSLRSRLVLAVLAAVAVLLGAFGLAVYLSARWAMVKEFDAGLSATAQALAGYAETAGGQVKLESEVAEFKQFARGSRRAFYEFWGPDGTPLHRSPSLRERNLPRLACPPNKPAFHALSLPGGRAGRAIVRQFQPRLDDDRPGPRPTVTLVVALETRELDERLEGLAWLLAAAGGAVMATATLVALLAVTRGLRPVRALAAGIEAIDADRLSQRVPTDAIPTELLPVGEKLNDMLTRLEAAFHRERAFTSDVAHELRTPLAGARTTFEVALTRPRYAQEYAQTLREGLDVLLRMQGLVESLLTLTRLDSGQFPIDRQEVDLADLARSCWHELAPRATDRRLRLEDLLPPRLPCPTDRTCLLLVLRNLLDNAVTYADAGGLVRLTAATADGRIELAVSNTGATLSPADLPHVFDRFWRGDAARSDTGLHCGLGLSLVHRALAAIGGTVTAALDEPGVFVVRVSLPAAP